MQTPRSPLSSRAPWPEADPRPELNASQRGYLNEAAEAACRQGVIQKIIALLNSVEITGDESRRGKHTLKTTTQPLERLERWHKNLRAEVLRRRENKQRTSTALHAA